MENQPTENELNEINKLLSLSDDELYIELAKSENMQGLPLDLLNWGKERFYIIKDNLKSKVCGSETVKHVCKSENGRSETEIIIAIGAALNIAVPGGSYLLVAALMFRYGINDLCAKQWG